MERRDKRRGDHRRKSDGPTRIPPNADPAGALERLVSRKQLRRESGDVVIARELMPRLQPSATGTRWWYRVGIFPGPGREDRVFVEFHHAATHGEHLAAQTRARLLFVEDGTSSLLNDYRER